MDVMDNLQKKSIIKMNEKLQERLNNRQEELKGPVKLQDYENMSKKQENSRKSL